MNAGCPPAPGRPFNRVGARTLATAVVLLCALALAGCASRHSRDAWLALGDFMAGAQPSSLKSKTAAPTRKPVVYRAAGRDHLADLYLPGDGAPEAALVLVPGVVPEGNRDARLVEFATTLARLRFAVLAPEPSGYRDLRIAPRHVEELAAAMRHLAARDEVPPGAPLGIAAFSYAAGPAVLAALQDDLRGRVDFVLAVGGYYSLHDAIRFFTTGWYDIAGERRHLQASQYPKMVFIRSTLEHLDDPRDRYLLNAMVDARLDDPEADLSSLAAGLGPQGRSVYRLLTNTDPARVPQLIEALPLQTQATLDALTLANKQMRALQARIILVHGKTDPLIPYSESHALARALPSGRANVFIIHRILGHVDLSLASVFSPRFWQEQIPDAWRLHRALTLLLRQRTGA